jgi:hypothetical protein
MDSLASEFFVPVEFLNTGKERRHQEPIGRARKRNKDVNPWMQV